jgi:membrane-bound ClpP family serine protease
MKNLGPWGTFWGRVFILFMGLGVLFIWLGFFEVHKLPLGISGILLFIIGVYLLATRWREFIDNLFGRM